MYIFCLILLLTSSSPCRKDHYFSTCLFEGAHGIHFTKKARFLNTSKKDYFVRDRSRFVVCSHFATACYRQRFPFGILQNDS